MRLSGRSLVFAGLARASSKSVAHARRSRQLELARLRCLVRRSIARWSAGEGGAVFGQGIGAVAGGGTFLGGDLCVDVGAQSGLREDLESATDCLDPVAHALDADSGACRLG
jgi:hypothetical protein